jgi:hypothetical protein
LPSFQPSFSAKLRHGAKLISTSDALFMDENEAMKNYTKILFSLLAAVICTATFAAEKPNCKKTGKNCPMNDKKECNCGKDCGCGK